MGWHFTHRTKKGALKELLGEGYGKALAHSLRPGALWVLHREADRDVNYITSYRLTYDVTPRKGWWYREEDENDWLDLVNCPLEFLKLAPVVSARWRRRVALFHRVPCSRSRPLEIQRPSRSPNYMARRECGNEGV